MNAYQAAEKLQAAYADEMAKTRQQRNNFFYVSHVLGSDWSCGYNFAGNPERYLEVIIEVAEGKFGPLPFNPFAL